MRLDPSRNPSRKFVAELFDAHAVVKFLLCEGGPGRCVAESMDQATTTTASKLNS